MTAPAALPCGAVGASALVLAFGLAGGCAPSAAPSPSSPSLSSPTDSPTVRPPPRPVVRSCGARQAAAMTPAERGGQLIMVGLSASEDPAALDALARAEHLGGVVYLGAWSGGVTRTSAVSARLQSGRGGGPKLLIAADQEGGLVQRLSGSGFGAIPSARAQAGLGTAREQRAARSWGQELAAAGVSADLAPVADTVPAAMQGRNEPIGVLRRDFAPGSPDTNARYARAFVRGMERAGVATTLKHFPGLGRVSGNTDSTSFGVTDPATSRTDRYLAPFAAGIAAGAGLVMVSSARYPRLDRVHQAVFSAPIIRGLLRARLGFIGVVISDDLGDAKAVASVPIGQRATRFLAAGGDLALVAHASQARPMLAAVGRARAADPAFAHQVDAAAGRVLALKARLGLARCGRATPGSRPPAGTSRRQETGRTAPGP